MDFFLILSHICVLLRHLTYLLFSDQIMTTNPTYWNQHKSRISGKCTHVSNFDPKEPCSFLPPWSSISEVIFTHIPLVSAHINWKKIMFWGGGLLCKPAPLGIAWSDSAFGTWLPQPCHFKWKTLKVHNSYFSFPFFSSLSFPLSLFF